MTAKYRIIKEMTFNNESSSEHSIVESFTDFETLKDLSRYLVNCGIVDPLIKDRLELVKDSSESTKFHLAHLTADEIEADLFVMKRPKRSAKKRIYLVTSIVFERREMYLTGCKVEKVISVVTKKFENVEEMLKCFNRMVARKIKNDLEMYDAKYMTEGKLVSETHFVTSHHSKVYLQLIDEEI